jgi:hypothetical protein
LEESALSGEVARIRAEEAPDSTVAQCQIDSLTSSATAGIIRYLAPVRVSSRNRSMSSKDSPDVNVRESK